MPPASSFASDGPQTLVVPIDRTTQVAWLQSEVRRFVRRNELSLKVEWALAIAVSEAATNVQKFAGAGVITLIGEPSAIVMVAEDDGPGLDPETALRDGVSEGIDLATVESRAGLRGLGTGLGAIHRLMGDLRIERRPCGGTRLVATHRLSKG